MQIIWMIFFSFCTKQCQKMVTFWVFWGARTKIACFTRLKANKLEISLDLFLLGLIHEVRNLSQYLIRFTMLSMFWFCIRNITCKDVMCSEIIHLFKQNSRKWSLAYIEYITSDFCRTNNSKSQTVNTCWITWVGIPYWEWGPLFRGGMKRGLVSRL